VVLEFSLPANRVIRFLYLLYFRHLLPRLGGLISGDRKAYRYLDQTVETYLSGLAFVTCLQAAGFENIKQRALTCGVVTIYTGVRP
jgi:demethylmenaquinone methyltransferase/2-methoxy-6-polyprenyl-1,4-benzoquinol methylase